MKYRSGKNSSKLIPALLALLILALTLTSCAPKQEPFDLEEVETLRPPSNIQARPPGKLEGVKIKVSWTPSPDDRYSTRIIAPRPLPGLERDKRTKYEIKTFDDRPRDPRTRYEIYRAVVKPGEDMYSLPPDRFIKVGEVDEGEYQFSDETTTPRRVWWQARRREVEKIPRTMQESESEPGTFINTKQTEKELGAWGDKGFKNDDSENNRNYIILHKVKESEKVPGSLDADGIPILPDTTVQRLILQKLAEGWELDIPLPPAVLVFKKPVFDLYTKQEIPYVVGPDGKPVKATREALERAVPFAVPLKMQISIPPQTKKVFDAVEGLRVEEGEKKKPIIISFDYDPATQGECTPMAVAMLRHAFATKTPVIGITFVLTGVGLGRGSMDRVAKEFNEKYGKGTIVYGRDYAWFGWKPMPMPPLILAMGRDITSVYEREVVNNTPVNQLPMMKGVRGFEDIGLITSIAGSALPNLWIVYANGEYKVKVAVGTTAVSATQYFPYMQTGQCAGMIAGITGAAAYERLVVEHEYWPEYGDGEAMSNTQSASHIVIILFIAFGNIIYFTRKARG